MNTYFTLEPFTIPDHKMSDEYPPDLAGDSSMSTAFEEDVDPFLCEFDMPDATTPDEEINFGQHSSPQVVSPVLTSAPTSFNCQSFEANQMHPALDPLHQLEQTPMTHPIDASYRSVVSVDSSTCTTMTAAELDLLCKEGIVKLKESMKRSSITRQEILRQRQILGY